MLVNVALVAFSAFFALNMGGAGLSPSFSAALGAKLVSRTSALIMFAICVGIGALFIGGHVANTLGHGFVPPSTLDKPTALIVIIASCTALFIASIVKIPESTSWVTVFAIIALGLERGNLTTYTITHKLLPAWLSIPVLAFLVTHMLTRSLYPLRGWNYRLYEHLTKHEWKLRILVIASSCYVAVAVGANSVANVVGPLAAAGLFSVRGGMLVFTPVFALGAIVFFRIAKAIGSDVVPLGLYSAMIINVVVGSMVLIVSWLGIPQSLVHAQLLSVLGVALAKEGSHELLRHPLIRRIAVFWVVSPLIAGSAVVLQLLIVGWCHG